MIIKAVILAGGKGKRLMPLTTEIPKPMVPVLNKPIIGHIINLLEYYHFNDISVTLQHMPTKITDYLLDNYNNQFHYFIEDIPLGTAGSVLNAAQDFKDTFLVISGDALTNIDLSEMYYFHKHNSAMVTMAVSQVEDPSKYGVIVANQNGLIVGFQEKPEIYKAVSRTINCGIYMLEPEIFKYIPENSYFDFALHLFPELIKNKVKMYAFNHKKYWCDIGDINTYYHANMDMLCENFNCIPLCGRNGSKEKLFEPVNFYRSFPNIADSIIGKNVDLGKYTVKNSIIWDNTVINAHMENAIVSSSFTVQIPDILNETITSANDFLKFDINRA